MFEEFNFRCGKVQFFPRSSVYLILYGIELSLLHLPEIGTFREILTQQPVGVLFRSFLPGAVRIREIDGRSQPAGQALMVPELHSVVRGDREYMAFVREQGPVRRLLDRVGILRGHLRLEKHVCAPFRNRQDGAPAVLPDHEIHLEVPGPGSVRLRRPLVDRHPVGNQGSARRLFRDLGMTAVFHLMPAVLAKHSVRIVPDVPVYRLVAYPDSLQPEPARDLSGRPVLLDQKPARLVADILADFPVGRASFPLYMSQFVRFLV